MSASLRYLVLLIALTFAGGVAAIVVRHHQTTHRAKIVAEQATGGSVAAGKAAILRYRCGACHQIPGISGANGSVGPSLEGFARRAEIAGLLSNDPAHLRLWLRHPQQVSPGSGMPDQGVSEPDARDISAYLYTLQ